MPVDLSNGGECRQCYILTFLAFEMKTHVFLIVIVFFIGFFINSIIAYGIVPAFTKFFFELSILLVFVYSFLISSKYQRKFKFDFSLLFIFFVIVISLSIAVNNTFNIKSILSIRTVLRAYIFYVAIINLPILENDFKTVNNIIIFLFIAQLPVVAYKFYIYGVSEKVIGTYGTGGGLTTLFPIVVLSYCFSWYIIYKKSIYFLVFPLLFIIWGIVGAKAALLFLFPIFLFGIYYVLIFKESGLISKKNFVLIPILSFFVIGFSYILISLQPRLNPDRTVGGQVNYDYVMKFSTEYETGERFDRGEYKTGRIAVTKMAFQQIVNSGIVTFLIGYGPGSLTPEYFEGLRHFDQRVEKIGHSYGISGMTFIFVEYGILGVAFFVIIFLKFLIRSWKWYIIEKDLYWKGFASGTFFFSLLILFIFLTYNKLPIEGIVLLPVFYYAMGVCFSKSQEKGSLQS